MTPLTKLVIRVPLMVLRLVTWVLGMLGILLVLANVARTKPDSVWDLLGFFRLIGFRGFWDLYWPHVLACLGANIVCGLTLLSLVLGATFKGMTRDVNDAVKYGDYEVRRVDTGEKVSSGTTAGADILGGLLGRLIVFVLLMSVAFLAVPAVFLVELAGLPFLIHGARKELGYGSARTRADASHDDAGSPAEAARGAQQPSNGRNAAIQGQSSSHANPTGIGQTPAVGNRRAPTVEPAGQPPLPGERFDLPDDPVTRRVRSLCHPELQPYAVGQNYFARADTAHNAFFLHAVLAVRDKSLMMRSPDGREVEIEKCQIINDSIPGGQLDAYYYDWENAAYRRCRADDVDAEMNFIVIPQGEDRKVTVSKNAFYYAVR